jgi:transcriptional regulator with XRE-family HTH domain
VARKSEFRCEIRGSFAVAFNKWRRKNKIPLKRIADELGVSAATINLWETGRRFPSGEHLEMLTAYTGVPPCELFCVMAAHCRGGKCLLAQWDGSSD